MVYNFFMAIDGPPEKNNHTERYISIARKAVAEIRDVLVRTDRFNTADEVVEEANRILDERYFKAVNIYIRNVERVEKTPTEEAGRIRVREILEKMEAAFLEDGYIAETTAKRLAAAIAQLSEGGMR